MLKSIVFIGKLIIVLLCLSMFIIVELAISNLIMFAIIECILALNVRLIYKYVFKAEIALKNKKKGIVSQMNIQDRSAA